MISLSNVTKHFGGIAAVEDLSFTVPAGRIACLIGPSGCGKTTTLKMINRLIEPDGGEIFVNGVPVSRADPIGLRRSLGYVIQQVGLLPHLTVKRNIALLAEVNGTSASTMDRRTDEVMILVGLDPEKFRSRYPHELSGGQQQRVGIARALMSDPPVLLMDEPFGALDPMIRSRLHTEFLTLNRKLHKTIVMVTHDLHEAFKMADEIILMNHGRMVQQGTRHDFLEKPADAFCSEFVQAQMEGIS